MYVSFIFPIPSKAKKKAYIIIVSLSEEVLFLFIMVCSEGQPLTFNCHVGQNFTIAAAC
jgi:hypothetical protein